MQVLVCSVQHPVILSQEVPGRHMNCPEMYNMLKIMQINLPEIARPSSREETNQKTFQPALDTGSLNGY